MTLASARPCPFCRRARYVRSYYTPAGLEEHLVRAHDLSRIRATAGEVVARWFAYPERGGLRTRPG